MGCSRATLFELGSRCSVGKVSGLSAWADGLNWVYYFFRVSPFLWDFLPCVKNPGDSQGSGLGCRGSAIGVFSREVYTVRMKTELSLIETVDERCACPCDPELG